jgi:hypothetical protein
VIASTLSSNSILPNGTYVEFDYEAYLGEMDDANTSREMVDVEENTQEEMA